MAGTDPVPQPPAAPPPLVPASPPPAAPQGWLAAGADEGQASFGRLVTIASFVPIGFVALLAVVAPGFYQPLLDERLAPLGLPPIVGFLAILLGLAAVNLLALRFVRNTVAVGLVVAVTTTLGLFVVILAPAVVLIAINLTA